MAEAVNNAAKAVSGAVNAAATAVNNAVKNANKVASGATNAASELFSNAGKNISSVIPFANTPKANNGANKKNNDGGILGNMFGNSNAAANAGKPPNATANVVSPLPPAANFNVAPMASPWAWPLVIFVCLVLVFLLIFSVFNQQIKQGYEYIFSSIRAALGFPYTPDVQGSIIPTQSPPQDVIVPPEAPQDETPKEVKPDQALVEKILPIPSDNREVFNVSQNKFTFYDAEPLCKALGAELATYEQVKSAWERGADWCNYGWVKGQMAIYPTQQDTYDKLQSGPVEERLACGTTGINGGFFDNPEMRYGVNCYGKKPSQSAHDEALLMKQGKVPPTPSMLKVDQKISEFKRDSDGLFVQPFNQQKWSDGLF